MDRRVWLSGALFVVSLLFGSVTPALAQGVGAIGGTVMDSSGAVLPGATVTLSSEQGTVGSNQESASDTRGAYQFLRLVPGTYIVKATMQGFRSVEQRNIVVAADATARPRSTGLRALGSWTLHDVHPAPGPAGSSHDHTRPHPRRP